MGVTLSGNEVGVTLAELAAMSELEKDALRSKAGTVLERHRPDYIIDTVADLLPVIADIERRLQAGERPGRPIEGVLAI